MLNKIFLVSLIAASLAGCASDANPVKLSTPEENLTAVAGRLKDDPNASVDTKQMASGVVQQIKNDQDARDFAAGK